MEDNLEYPVRINKYLAFKGIASRREADRIIAAGRVRINGQAAKPGDKVAQGDQVEIGAGSQKKRIYLAFNKPIGVATHSSQKGEKDISDLVKLKDRVYPVGRLDKESEGLIILTNDGRITDRLLNPAYDHEKEYEVQVNKDITSDLVKGMRRGVVLEDGYRTKECRTEKLGERLFSIVLTEGKRHQIRRMTAALGYEVRGLRRVRVMNVKLGSLAKGQWRELGSRELPGFLKSLGLASSSEGGSV